MKLSSSTQELAKQEFINLKQSCYANLFHFPLVCIFTDCMLSDAVVAAASITLIDNSGSLSKKLVLDNLRHTPIKVKTNIVICQEVVIVSVKWEELQKAIGLELTSTWPICTQVSIN